MRQIGLIFTLLFLLLIGIWLTKPFPQSKPVAITILDSRISELELKVKNLENWTQKHEAKY